MLAGVGMADGDVNCQYCRQIYSVRDVQGNYKIYANEVLSKLSPFIKGV